MKYGAWSADEADTIFEMRAIGEKWTVIAATLGRPYDAVVTFYRDEKRRRVAAPTPVRLPPESRPDFEATILLGNAINAAIYRHAYRQNVTLERAIKELLGGNSNVPIPGTETYFGTASAMRRLAA